MMPSLARMDCSMDIGMGLLIHPEVVFFLHTRHVYSLFLHSFEFNPYLTEVTTMSMLNRILAQEGVIDSYEGPVTTYSDVLEEEIFCN
jgi:hypothetical protein